MYGLSARPTVPIDEMAALEAAAEEILKEQSEQTIDVDTVPSWRFSGRWFNSGP